MEAHVRRSTVIVWDQQRSSLDTIRDIVLTCASTPQTIEGIASTQELLSSGTSFPALVALGKQPAPGDLILELIRTLKRKGFAVICYENGLNTWPIPVRARALLAGSQWLLDSSQPDFADELRRLIKQLLSAAATAEEEEHRIKDEMRRLGIVGESSEMMTIFRWMLSVSPLSDLPVLITGETGTGKELVARAIYRLDPKRCRGPFIAVNCGAITTGLAESELFGHRRGAFTGAEHDRKGLIRSAQGGVLLLDEISELDLTLQTKLLRVLQENRVLGVGQDIEVPVDVRIIAASNRNLNQMVQEKTFRADLFHRLNILSVQIPPLRARQRDIPCLVKHFVGKHEHLSAGQSNEIGTDFIEALTQIDLPGNARQLENVLRQSLVNKRGDPSLRLSHLPTEIWEQLSSRNDEGTASAKVEATSLMRHHKIEPAVFKLLEENEWNLQRSLDCCEKIFLQAALNASSGNQAKTARTLGITARSVYNKVRKHGLPSSR